MVCWSNYTYKLKIWSKSGDYNYNDDSRLDMHVYTILLWSAVHTGLGSLSSAIMGCIN